ncbi:MAG: hypothetical protein F9K30_01770 [Dechloromonas sp.]|nr:MAG: hypothetical protein F9K30_01770 [Dechloromonas sp.]
MSAHCLLYLNTHRLTAYAWRQGRLHAEGVFENGEQGLTAFRDYLQDRQNCHLSLLANIAEEGHVLETIPFLQGADRQALITRKIGQHFMGSPLAAAFSLGYEKNRRKNEKLLLSALTNPAHFDPWLQRIADSEVPLAGIYTVAQLAGPLLNKLGGAAKRSVLLSMQDHSIRESYVVDGRTLFSRMAPISDSSIAGIASSFAAEAAKLQQYLIGQRLIGRDENLPVFIIAYPPAIPAIDNACPDRGNLSFSIIDSHHAAEKLGLKTPPEDNRCDPLYLHLLATSPPRQQFASAAHRHDFQLARIRRGILALGLTALLGGLLFAARESYHAHTLRHETQELQAREADMQARYQEISSSFPQLGIDNDTLRRLTDRHAELSRQQRQPEAALRRLSRAVDQVPAIALVRIDWQIGRKSSDTSAVSEGREEITTVHGNVRLAPAATIRQVLATFEQFVDLLRLDPDNTVRILQPPYDMVSDRTLRGGEGIGVTGDSAQVRPFAVEIVRTIAP